MAISIQLMVFLDFFFFVPSSGVTVKKIHYRCSYRTGLSIGLRRSDHAAFWLQYIQKTGASTSTSLPSKRMVTPLSSERVCVLGSGP